MSRFAIKIACGCIGLATCGAVAGGITHFSKSPLPKNAPAPPVKSVETAAPAVVHDSNWYLAHRDILKLDEQRCIGDAAHISSAACKNVSSAVSEVDYENAQDILKQSIKPSK